MKHVWFFANLDLLPAWHSLLEVSLGTASLLVVCTEKCCSSRRKRLLSFTAGMEPSAHWCLARSLSFSPASIFCCLLPTCCLNTDQITGSCPSKIVSFSFMCFFFEHIGSSGEVLTGAVLELFLFPWTISGMLNRSALLQTHWLYELLMDRLLFIWNATCCIYLSFSTLYITFPLLKIVCCRLIYCAAYTQSWQKAGWALPKNFPPTWMSSKFIPSKVICHRLVCIPYMN